MSRDDPLATLLSGCAEGDERAFEDLYRQASARLYGTCLNLLRREDMAEDVLQDSFVKIWYRAGSYDPARGSAMTWMTSIVRNRALDLLRSGHLQSEQASESFQDLDWASLEPGPGASAERDAATQAVIDCLYQLRDSQRRCIVLAYVHGHTHEELARKLSTPLGTIKAWIRRGMQRLRECLD